MPGYPRTTEDRTVRYNRRVTRLVRSLALINYPRLRAAAWVVACLLSALPAFAQADGDGAAAGGVEVGGANGGGGAGWQQVSLKVSQFGVGNICRGGGWIGVLVEFSDDAADKPRDLVFRLTLPDPDRDTVQYERAVTANPGVRQSVWLYAWLPFDQVGAAVTVSVHEAAERVGVGGGGDGSEESATRLTAGRQLGKIEAVPNRNRFGPGVGLLGVVGRSEAGLGQYARFLGSAGGGGGWGGSGFSPTGHELTDVVGGLSPSPAGLPDRWQGLAQFESIVWTGSSLEYQPSRLSQAQADALREWVRRGGHLVVVLPSVGQTWLTGSSGAAGGGRGNNPLADLMPSVAPIRHENVDLNGYSSLLTRPPLRSSVTPTLPRGAVVHEFRATPSAGPYDAMPILVGPSGDETAGSEGGVIVVRKLYGHGAVSVIGIDLAQTALAASSALRADVFWHRVLGRRYLLELPRQSTSQDAAAAANAAQAKSFARVATNLDDMIDPTIQKSGQAAAGLLLAIVVFAAYWFVAGLGSYAYLSKKNRKQHAWLAFVGVAALFTAIAWGGAGLIRIRHIEGRHLTVLDHVYGQEGQRAREWATIFLPTYGDRTIAVMPQDSAGAGNGRQDSADLIAAMDPGRDAFDIGGVSAGGGGVGKAFPDARAYAVDCRRPSAITVPTRSTVKQVTADWMGAIPNGWGMIHPVAELGEEAAAADVAMGREIALVERPKALGSLTRAFRVRGDLVHDLPGELHDVTVVLVVQQQNPRQSPESMPAITYCGKMPAPWKAGDRLDLETAIPAESKAINGLNKALDDVLGREKPSGYGFNTSSAGSAGSVKDEMLGLSFFNVLSQPLGNDGDPGAVRTLGYGLDLSRWITQPCIIVLGVMNDTPGPVPLGVDGEDVRGRINGGRTIVRWIYPLPPNPPAYVGAGAERLDEEEPSSQ